MRGWLVISVLALAGCGEHQGWNPNYQFGASPYGKYRVEREAALTSGSEPSHTVPVARPVDAPTGAQIAGRDPVPAPATMGVRTVRRTVAPAAAAGAATQQGSGAPTQLFPQQGAAVPVTSSGPYAGSTPVLVRYAFSVDHQPGTQVYNRSGGSTTQAARTCASFATPAAAQTAFLAAGGPQRDPRGMDPDGDGFVCGWDPAPYRVNQL